MGKHLGGPGPVIQPAVPESCTELSTSFALASEGSCTWLSSLVSLACSSGPVVIHGAIPILRLIRRSSYLIVNLRDPGSSQPEDISVPGSPRRLEGKQPSR